MEIFGIQFGAVEWATLGTTAVAILATARSFIRALKAGTETVKNIAQDKIVQYEAKIEEIKQLAEDKMQLISQERDKLREEIAKIHTEAVRREELIREALENE